MKFSPSENVKLYAGIKVQSMWMLIVGVKVAGIKLLMPWTNLQYLLFPH